MKLNFRGGMLLVLAALCGVSLRPVKAEPIASGQVSPTSSPSNSGQVQQAYGWWTGQYTAADKAATQAGQTQLADWMLTGNDVRPVSHSAAETSVQQWMGGEAPAAACDCCPDPLWVHRNGAFFDFLYLRPGNIDYIYAVEQTGPLSTDSPTGPTGRVGFDGAPGFRVGATVAMSECSSIQATYTWFESSTQNSITANGGNVLIFQPGDPSIPNVGSTSVTSSATDYIRFQQIDLDYRGLLYGTCDSAINYFAGFRYANLKQAFSAQQDVGVPVGLSTVNTEINFDGAGIGFGLDGMKRSAYSGLLIYGRASSSFVAGEFKADYVQVSQFGPNSRIANTLVDYRLMTILQTELGLGWQNQCGNLRILGGYQVAGWFNALTTGSYIPGVQNRQFNNLNETITFDGLTSRVEYRF
jgi:hypothetical protein